MTNKLTATEALNGLLLFSREDFANPDFAALGSPEGRDVDAKLDVFFDGMIEPDAPTIFNQIAAPLLPGERARYSVLIAESAGLLARLLKEDGLPQAVLAEQLEASAVAVFKSTLTQLKPTDMFKILERDASSAVFSSSLLQASIDHLDAMRPSLPSERQQVRSDRIRTRVRHSLAMLADE